MLLERLSRDLPTVAEAIDSLGRSPEQRRRLANGAVEIISRWRMASMTATTTPITFPAYEPAGSPSLLRSTNSSPDKHRDLWPRLSVTIDVSVAVKSNETVELTELAVERAG
jgi:hypothetical protein